MFKNAIGILAGVCCLQWAAALPSWAAWAWVIAFAAFALRVCSGRPWVREKFGPALSWMLGLMALLILGYAYAAWRAELRMADDLDSALEGRDLLLTGVIASLPDDNGDGVRFVFEVEKLAEAERGQSGVPRWIWLSWYRPRGSASPVAQEVPPLPDLQPGERWRLPVRLRRPHGSAVPGVFDYEAWLLGRGLRATGYVRGQGERLTADSGGFMNGVHRLRARIRQQFETTLPDAPYRGVLVALAVGDQNAIPQDQWDILRRTGIQHLVAISGLHITLVALAAGGLCALLWRRIPALVLRCPARLVGAASGLAAAFAYALLAGLGIPVQRALVMLTVVAIAMAVRRETGARNVLALALLAVLAVDPWAPLAAGFWLSFGAVGVIVLCISGRIVPVQGWRAAVRLQLAITLATVPVLVALFQGFSLASPLANAIAIPIVNFAITPLVLIAAIWPAGWLLELSHLLTAWMMIAMQWLAASPLALHEQPLPPPWLLAAAVVSVGLLILPRSTPGRLAALALLGGFFLWQPPRPATGDFRAAVLDVGQGLAVHVQTASHDLLYDAGPFHGQANDAGGRVILPYLRASGLTRLDAAMISHDDTDHAGGLPSVQAQVEIAKIMAGDADADPAAESEPVKEPPPDAWHGRQHEPVRGEPCIGGLHWRWDDVDFTVLAPETLSGRRRDNAESCVLRIGGAGGVSLLLTGDIESGGERRLVDSHGEALASTAVVAAHHGSRSSSSAPFIAATNPEVVIFSAGYRNRYRHPHPGVLARWAEAGARNLRTDTDGTVLLEAAGEKLEAIGWRERNPRYWHGR